MIRWNERRRELAKRARKTGAPGRIGSAELQAVLDSADGLCAYCARRLRPRSTHFEHCTPLARGGSNSADNIVMACKRCNLKKARKTVLEFMFPGCNSPQTQFTFRPQSAGESRKNT